MPITVVEPRRPLNVGARYSKDHEYVRVEGGEGFVGISDYAQQQLGDVVFAETPPVGKALKKGDPAAVVEASKRRATCSRQLQAKSSP